MCKKEHILVASLGMKNVFICWYLVKGCKWIICELEEGILSWEKFETCVGWYETKTCAN